MRAWVFALIAALPLIARAGEITVLTHSTAHQVSVEGPTLRGLPKAGRRAFYVELVRALLQELRLADRIEDVPLARGLMMVQQLDDIAFFNVDRTPEREDRMQWVGPISQDVDTLYERAGAAHPVLTLEDARSRRICVLRGNVHDRNLSALGFAELERASSYEQCLRMLDAGRVDLVASATQTMHEKLADVGMAPDRIRRTPVVLSKTEGYIALSRAIPAPEVARWNHALSRLKASGRYRALYARYMPTP